MATPIGNLEDLSHRAIRVLRSAELVACEDTRVSRTLLRRIGAAGRCLALHAHNEAERAPSLLEAVAGGSRVALISDAGTPAVSDPGARLVAAAQERGLTVVPVPGPSAVTAAISVAALVDGRFRFEGFLPARAGQRRARLLELATSDIAVVLFEAPHRITALAADLTTIVEPTRTVVVARELTKRFEQIARLAIADLASWLAADPDRRRGEFVVVLHPPMAGSGGTPQSTTRTAAGAEEVAAGTEGGTAAGSGAGAASTLAATDDGRTAGTDAAALPSELGRRAVAILAETLPPRAAARAAARISGDDADALYRFRASRRSTDAGP